MEQELDDNWAPFQLFTKKNKTKQLIIKWSYPCQDW